MSKTRLFASREAELNNYLNNSIPYLTTAANATRLDIDTPTVTKLNNALINWQTFYPQCIDNALRTKLLVAQKNVAKKEVIVLLRSVYVNIQGKLDLADRTTLNLLERAKPTPAPVPTTRPVCNVNTSNRLCHCVRSSDEMNPGKRGKPARTRGVQLWSALSATGVQPPLSEFNLITFDSKTSITVNYDSSKAGQTAFYMARWENTRGEVGPWSETVSATIVG